MLVIRILGLQAALVAAQLLNVTDIPVVGDVVGDLLGGGGGTTTTAPPDVVAVPDPVPTPEPATPVVEEPEVVDIPETVPVPAPVEATPAPAPEPVPEPTPESTPEPQAPVTPVPEPAVVVPPVVVVPTPETVPVVPQQQPPADIPAAPAPAANSPAPAANNPAPAGAPAAVFVPPAQQQPAAAPAPAASPSTGGAGAGGVILANPGVAPSAPQPGTPAAAPNPGTTASPGMSVFVPPAVAAAVAAGTTSLDANGVPILPTPGPSPDGSVAQDLPAGPNSTPNTDLTNGQVTKEEGGGGMSMGTKIAAGVAGGAGGVVILVVVLYLFWKRRMRSAWRKKLERPASGGAEAEAKFNVAGTSSADAGKVEWVETGHDVTFDFGFEKTEARIAHTRGASKDSGFSGSGVGVDKDLEAGYGHRVELEGDSPPVSRAGFNGVTRG